MRHILSTYVYTIERASKSPPCWRPDVLTLMTRKSAAEYALLNLNLYYSFVLLYRYALLALERIAAEGVCCPVRTPVKNISKRTGA